MCFDDYFQLSLEMLRYSRENIRLIIVINKIELSIRSTKVTQFLIKII